MGYIFVFEHLKDVYENHYQLKTIKNGTCVIIINKQFNKWI